ncbi:VanZ family protein [Chamaesiphon polymorphus]|uniref:Trypsin n=1 Tax=Chamaesiphon polymorphus CCALA 037 TaxID=2107692 RepID=A0A2T1G9F3_9CYAN|nr:VanZ family protein [Chamaesiphon polymorphus]PSB53803.1 trypsin [Chamaesiphon polymorphus CCALA 037]
MRLKRWLPFSLFFLFVASIIVGSNVGRLTSITSLVDSLPFGDKWGHLVLIGLLTFLLNHALSGRKMKIGRLKILLGGTIVAVAITVEEISQIWMPLRSFDLIDLSANYLGITLAGLPWWNRNAVVDR